VVRLRVLRLLERRGLLEDANLDQDDGDGQILMQAASAAGRVAMGRRAGRPTQPVARSRKPGRSLTFTPWTPLPAVHGRLRLEAAASKPIHGQSCVFGDPPNALRPPPLHDLQSRTQGLVLP